MSPLDTIFENNGYSVEKRRRTYTSWFTDKDFLQSSAAKLRPAPGQDPVSKFIYDNLAPETRQILQASGNEDQLRRDLCKDLNVLIDRELETRKRIGALQRKRPRLTKKSPMASSESLRQRQDELAKQLADLSKISPLYEPERFKQVQISEYLQDFIKQNPQSHTRVRLNRLLLSGGLPQGNRQKPGWCLP